MRVQITTSTFGKAGNKPLLYLEENGIDFTVNPYGRKVTEEEAIVLLQGSDGVVAGTEPLTKKVLEKLPDLKVISRCGTATDNIDMETAKKQKIQIFNTPDIHVDAVAELAFAGTISLMRHLAISDMGIRAGNWKKKMGRSLFNKKVGLIGYGRVAKRFETMLKPFTQNIYFCDPYILNKHEYSDKYLEFENLLAQSDIISLHIPYTIENHHLINADNMKLVKSDALIINTSRGGLIDEDSLYSFLKNNPESGAYLDVFSEEPYSGRLIELENILLTPHIGTTTRETREEMEYQACFNLIKGLRNV